MNATSLDEIRAAQAGSSAATTPASDLAAEIGVAAQLAAQPNAAAAPDTRMEQIRQLLLGDTLASSAERLATLERRQADFEKHMLDRLDLLSQRLDALSRDVLADRRAAFDELARAMQDLGNRVRGI